MYTVCIIIHLAERKTEYVHWINSIRFIAATTKMKEIRNSIQFCIHFYSIILTPTWWLDPLYFLVVVIWLDVINSQSNIELNRKKRKEKEKNKIKFYFCYCYFSVQLLKSKTRTFVSLPKIIQHPTTSCFI